ncbi:trypsin-like serine protease [Meiothermus sp.]|uniref:trypsin-like serine protease n=1 Tax=Meiothermus sp. TaxID=1955249 RepID=UPI00307E6149
MKQLVRLALLAVLALALAACGSSMQSASSEGVSSQITYGELDGNRHPYVGLMVAQDANGNPLWRCSGTLMSPTLFLTAGHCTEPPAAKVEIWFDADVDAGRPGNGFPFTGQTGGTPYTHPQYDPNAFFRYDLGMVVLDAHRPMPMSQYGALPRQDVLDRLARQRGLQNTTFTAVGYGLQRINPVFVEAARVRMLARPHLVQINTGFTGDFSILLSNNASTGGTCFGDSGGPNFIGDSNVIGGVTSFGINGNCAGTGGVYRIDRKDDLDWLATFGLFPQP